MIQNLLRKSLFFNYDYYKALGKHAFENNDNILSHHVSEYRPITS